MSGSFDRAWTVGGRVNGAIVSTNMTPTNVTNERRRASRPSGRDKAGFKTPIDIRFIGNGKWLVIRDIVYRSKKGERIVIPARFVTDLTSVPRFLWALLPPHGNYLAAAVLHDYLYYIQDRTRGECDSLLREAMEHCEGVNRLTRWAVFSGVRSGGWLSFRDHKANRKIRDAVAEANKWL